MVVLHGTTGACQKNVVIAVVAPVNSLHQQRYPIETKISPTHDERQQQQQQPWG